MDVGSVCLACHCVRRTQGSRWEEFVTGGLADRKARSSCQGLKGKAVGEEKAMEKLPISPEEKKFPTCISTLAKRKESRGGSFVFVFSPDSW